MKFFAAHARVYLLELFAGARETLARGGLIDIEHRRDFSRGELTDDGEEQADAQGFAQTLQGALHCILFRQSVCQVRLYFSAIAWGLRGGGLFIDNIGGGTRSVRFLFHARERDETKEAAAAPLHTHRIQGNREQPGFGAKLRPTFGARGIYGFQRLVKGVLSEVLALLPITRQAVNRMENQFAVFLNEDFYRLRGRQGIHKLRLSYIL